MAFGYCGLVNAGEEVRGVWARGGAMRVGVRIGMPGCPGVGTAGAAMIRRMCGEARGGSR